MSKAKSDPRAALAAYTKAHAQLTAAEAALKASTDDDKTKLQQALDKASTAFGDAEKALLAVWDTALEEARDAAVTEVVALKDVAIADLTKARDEALALLDELRGAATADRAAVPLVDGKVRVTVTGPSKGRYRARRLFNRDPQTIDVTPAELEAIAADKALSYVVEAAD